MAEIDFEGTAINTNTSDDVKEQKQEEDVTSLEGTPDKEDVTGKSNETKEKEEENNQKSTKENSKETNVLDELGAGDVITYDGVEYTIDDDRNLVDADGNVFKSLDELGDVEISEENSDELNINNIVKAIGLDVTDENGNAIEYPNSVEGVKDYIQTVLGNSVEDIKEDAINELYNSIPNLKEFIDYVELNGTHIGFGSLPDRRQIQLQRDNVEQHKAIIRQAALEFGNKTLNESYIKYLEDSGRLYEEAETQLNNLIQLDIDNAKQREEEVNRLRAEQEQQAEEYAEAVYNTIKSRKLGDIELPSTFIRNINGVKKTATLDDFYKYVSEPNVVDEEGNTKSQYAIDLDSLSEQEVINKDILDAWLLFTGNTYKDLISMYKKEDEVKKLIISSKKAKTNHSIKTIKSKAKSVDFNDILFG